MITVFNRYLSENLRALEACKTLPGIGKTMARQVLDQLGINYNVKLKDLSTNQLQQLNYIIPQRYKVTDELRAFVQKNKTRLSLISCYRGYRHSQALPCRGQRTHGNANTARKSKGTRVHN